MQLASLMDGEAMYRTGNMKESDDCRKRLGVHPGTKHVSKLLSYFRFKATLCLPRAGAVQRSYSTSYS